MEALSMAQSLRVEAVMKILRATCEKRLRCPTNDEIARALGSLPFYATPADLARRGLVDRVEVYGQNWRVVQIGDKRSAEYKAGSKPYRIIDKDGDHWVTHSRENQP